MATAAEVPGHPRRRNAYVLAGHNLAEYERAMAAAEAEEAWTRQQDEEPALPRDSACFLLGAAS